MPLPKKLALIGSVAGIALAVALGIASAIRRSPGGAGENVMWLDTYAAILGAPLSLLVAAIQMRVGAVAAQSAVVLAVIPINWAVVGYVVGWILQLFGRRGGP